MEDPGSVLTRLKNLAVNLESKLITPEKTIETLSEIAETLNIIDIRQFNQKKSPSASILPVVYGLRLQDFAAGLKAGMLTEDECRSAVAEYLRGLVDGIERHKRTLYTYQAKKQE